MDAFEYSQFLDTPEWNARRIQILKRDNYQCKNCKRKQFENGLYTQLNVHHVRYFKSLLPWEYNDNDLETLCKSCHKQKHNKKLYFDREAYISIDWQELNRSIFEGIIPKEYEVRIEGHINQGKYDYLRKSYGNFYYLTYLKDHQNYKLKPKFKVAWEGKKFVCFLKGHPYTFFQIYESIFDSDYSNPEIMGSSANIYLGKNEKTIDYKLISGSWVTINTGFDFYLTDQKDNILISTRRVKDEYINSPVTKNSIETFIEKTQFRDIELIIENKIIEKIPFMK